MNKIEELFQFLGTELFLSEQGNSAQDEAYTCLDSIISNLFPNQLTILPMYQNNLEFKSQDYLGTIKPLTQNSTDLILGLISDPLRSNEIIKTIWKTLQLRTETPMSSFLLSTISAATGTTPNLLSNHKKSSKPSPMVVTSPQTFDTPPHASTNYAENKDNPKQHKTNTGRQSRKDKHDSNQLKTGLATAFNSYDSNIKLVKFDYSQQSIQLLYKDLTILLVINPSTTIMASMTIGYQLLLWTLTHKITTYMNTPFATSTDPAQTTSSLPITQLTYKNYHIILQAELLIRVLWPVVDPIVLKLLLCCALNLQAKSCIDIIITSQHSICDKSITENNQHRSNQNNLTISAILYIFSKYIISHDFSANSSCSLYGPISQTSLHVLNTHPLLFNTHTGRSMNISHISTNSNTIPTSYPLPPQHYLSAPITTPVSLTYPSSSQLQQTLSPNETLTSSGATSIQTLPFSSPLSSLLSSTELQTLIDLCNVFTPPPITQHISSNTSNNNDAISFIPHPSHSTTESTEPVLYTITTPVPPWLQLTPFAPLTLLCPFHLFLNIAKSCNYSQRVRLQSVSLKLQELLISTIFYSHTVPEHNIIILPPPKSDKGDNSGKSDKSDKTNDQDKSDKNKDDTIDKSDTNDKPSSSSIPSPEQFSASNQPIKVLPSNPTITVSHIDCSSIQNALNLFQPICTQLNISAMIHPYISSQQDLPQSSLSNSFAEYMIYAQNQQYLPYLSSQDLPHDIPTQSFHLSYSFPLLEDIIPPPIENFPPTIHSELPASLSSLFHIYFQTIKPITLNAIPLLSIASQNQPISEQLQNPSHNPTLSYLFPHYVPPSLLLHTLTQLKNTTLSFPPLHSTSTKHKVHNRVRSNLTISSTSSIQSTLSTNGDIGDDSFEFPLPMTQYAQAGMNNGSFDRSLSRASSQSSRPSSSHSQSHSTLQSHHPRSQYSNQTQYRHGRSNSRSNNHSQTTQLKNQPSQTPSLNSCSYPLPQFQPQSQPQPHQRTVTLKYISGPLFIPPQTQQQKKDNEDNKKTSSKKDEKMAQISSPSQ